MRGKFLIEVLTRLADGVVASADLAGAMIESGYGASHSKIQFAIQKRQNKRDKDDVAREIRYASYAQYYNMLAYLKKDGLVEERFVAGKKFLKATSAGLVKLKLLKEKAEGALPDSRYEAEKGDATLIISFDIPEKQRRKRDWLRSALKNMNFRMVQQSVWVGNIQLPKTFLNDIRDLQLGGCVEIFRATKSGSLRKITS